MTDAGSNEAGPNPGAALAALATIAADASPSLIVIARRGDDPPELAATRPTNHLAAALRSVALDHAERWSNRELIPYGPATDVADGQVMWVPATTVPVLAAVGTVGDSDLADLPLFDPAAAYASRLRLSAIRVPTASGYATFYRALRPSQILARAGKLPIFRRGDQMDLADQRTVLIDRGVDAIVVDEVAFFTNRKAFQRVFGFLDEIRAAAGATFDDVTAELKIDGLEEMRAAATGEPAMLGKMASIARKLKDYPAYGEAITMPKLVEFVLANPHTGVEVAGEGDAAKLVFKADPQHRFKILKLLDDDYLQSQLTQLDYEANSKGLPLS